MYKKNVSRPALRGPAGGAYSAPPDLLAGFKGPLSGRKGTRGVKSEALEIIPLPPIPGSATALLSHKVASKPFENVDP